MKVLLKLSDGFQIADCDLASPAEVEALAFWPNQMGSVRSRAAKDALEFASLTRKRWQSYVELGRTCRTVSSLKKRIAADPAVEVVMLATIRFHRRRTASVLGFCLFRRTWCNHLLIDLLATNPSEAGHVGRVGASLVYFVASVGDIIRAPFIWGEATEDSAPYYNWWFNTTTVDDLFRIDSAGYREFKSNYLKKWRESGLLPS